jgi:hypothetical protein
MPDQQQWPFAKPMEFLQKVKYGGVVGKKTVIAVVLLLILGTAIVAVHGQTLPILLIVAVAVIACFGALHSLDQSVKAHPELALMDGGEIVAYRKVELAAKNVSIVHLEALPVPDPNPPLLEGGEQPEED